MKFSYLTGRYDAVVGLHDPVQRVSSRLAYKLGQARETLSLGFFMAAIVVIIAVEVYRKVFQ